jgi:hypothetical protein
MVQERINANNLQMKVMCIDDTKWHKDSKCPAFGEICTVEKSFNCPGSGTPSYSFFEYPIEPPAQYRCFSQSRFVPLSEIDETELVNEREQVYG